MAVLARGSVIAGHRIESFLGRGGMGVVYRARQVGLDRVVALKVIAPELLEDASIRERFLREARAAARIEHPNVIPVHAAGEEDGVAYIAMRFVDGDDLRALVRREGPLPAQRAAGLVAQAAAALDAIHAAGFIHRDVKPANVLVTPDGHAYLTDFGLAKQVVTRSGMTRTGGWVGSLDYVSPEQIRGGRIDARADVYALGGVLHYTLTGAVPFEREGQEAKLWAQLRDPPPVPSQAVPELPRELDAVVARAMAKDPGDRYPSAGDLGRAARAGAGGAVPSVPERMVARGGAAPAGAEIDPGLDMPTVTAAPATTVLPPRRSWRPAALVAVAALAGAGLAALLLPRGGTPRKPAPTAFAATPAPPSTPTATPAATPAGVLRLLGTTRHVGYRPSGIVLAGDDAWVISQQSAWLTRLSRRTGQERRAHLKIGTDANSIAADGSVVWVAMPLQSAVVRIDARSGAITRRLPTPQPPRYVAAGPSGLWIATSSGAGGTDHVLRYDRAGTKLAGTWSLPNGAGPIAAGGGALWVAATATSAVMRISAASKAMTPWAFLHSPGKSMTYADGYGWASSRDTNEVNQIRSRSGGSANSSVCAGPSQTAYGHGYLFVACNGDHTLVVLAPRSMRVVGHPIPVPQNPYAVAADARGVWVTGMAGNTVTRLAYR